MSWNISVYAEKYVDGEWKYIMPLHDNFKWLVSENYFDDLQPLLSSEYENVSSELKLLYKSSSSNNLFSFYTVKVATPTEMQTYASSLGEKSAAIKKTIWTALGLPEYTDDEYEEILNDKYDADGNIDPSWNPLTHPVSKELFTQLQEADFDAHKGYRILGMLDALEAACDYDDKVRLILVRDL